jgi:putative endonuclease
MTFSTKQTGDKGEDLAVQFLKNNGYDILNRNWRWGRSGEIDVVARKGGILVFCEVKMSTFAGDAHPELRVDHRKQMNLSKLAQAYMIQNPCYFDSVRFDIIAVKPHHGRDMIEHFENAFWPPEGWDR